MAPKAFFLAVAVLVAIYPTPGDSQTDHIVCNDNPAYQGDTRCSACSGNNGVHCQVGNIWGWCQLDQQGNSICEVCSKNSQCVGSGSSQCNSCNTLYSQCERAYSQSCTGAGGATGTCVADSRDTAQGMYPYLCSATAAVSSDPIITGFTGKPFHFANVGDFSILHEAEGWKVDGTFSAVSVDRGEDVRESSWTTDVRVYSPTGDMVSCSLPAIRPNTSTVQMSAVAANNSANHIDLSSAIEGIEFSQMSAKAVLESSTVQGCRITTPKMEIIVTQAYGWKEAALRPELDGWTAPFTWLNMNFKITQPLAYPVTGVLGDTYPKEGTVEALSAAIDGEAPHEGRTLASTNAPFSLSAGIAVGK